MDTTIYIFGNIQTFAQALVSLQMLFNPSNNTDWAVGSALFGVGPIVMIGMLLSLLHIATRGIWTQKIELHQVGILLVLYSAMFIPKTDVVVQDMFSGQSQPISNIPIGVAYPASIVSQLAYDAAVQIGQAFQNTSASAPPTDIANGFGSPLQHLLDTRKLYGALASNNPILTTQLVQFVAQCTTPATRNGSSANLREDSLLKTTDLLGVLFNSSNYTSGTIGFTQPIGGGNCSASGSKCSMSCSDAASSLKVAFDSWISSNAAGGCASAIGRVSGGETSKPLQSCDGTEFNDILVKVTGGSMGNLIAASSTNGAAYLKNVLGACIATAGFQMGASLTTQTSYSLPDYCLIDTMTLDQMQVSKSGAATMFQQNMLPMMSVLQFLFFALAPLAAAAMVLAGGQGVSMFLKYLTFGMWTQSWLPVAAVLNGYAQMSAQQELGRLALMAADVGATASTGDALVQWANLSLVFHNVEQILSNAHMMLALTPVITMIVFTGSYMGMANLAQDITAQDKVDRNMGTVAPDLGAPNVAQQFGVSGIGASTAGGSAAFGSGASNLSMVASNVVGAGTEAAMTQAATNASTYGQRISEQARWAASHASEHNDSAIKSLVNGERGTFSQSTAMGQTYSSLKARGLSDAEAMSFAVGINSAAMQAYNSGKRAGMSDAQATKMAEQAAQSFMDQAKKYGGAALSGALGGLVGGIETTIRDTLTNEQKRSDTFDAVRRTQAALDQYADSSFAKSTNQTEKHGINRMKEDAKQAAYATDTSANEAASLAKKASEMASLGSGAKLTYTSALGELRNLAANGGPSVRQVAQDVLTRATQGNQAAADKALAIAARSGYQGDEQMLYAAFLAASGKTEGVTAVGAAEASAALLDAVYGSKTGRDTLAKMRQINGDAGERVKDAQAKVQEGADGLEGAGTRAADAGQSAEAGASKATERPTPDKPLQTPGAVGGPGAQDRVWSSGKAQVNGNVSPVVGDMKANQEAINRAAGNTNSPLMSLVKAMAADPELTAAAITAANALAGVLGAWSAMNALNKVLQAGKGAAPGVPPAGGPSTTPGGGGAAGRPGSTPASKPGLPPGGDGGGSPKLGGPPNTAAVLDAHGNVIGHTAIAEAEQAAAKAGKPVASVLAARAAAMGGAALRVGSAVFGVLGSGPAMGAQLFLHSSELGDGTLDQGKRHAAIARLSEKDPSFQKDSELVKQAVASGKQTPEVQAAYARIQTKIAEETKRME